MKKILSIVLIACMMVSLTACTMTAENQGRKKETTVVGPATSTEEPAASVEEPVVSVEEPVASVEEPAASDVIESDRRVSEYDFEGAWQCNRCSIDIVCKGEEYEVLILWADSATEANEWSYSCTYNPGTRILVCDATGSQLKVVTADDGTSTFTTTASDISATFYIKDGQLIWLIPDSADEPMVFEKMEY